MSVHFRITDVEQIPQLESVGVTNSSIATGSTIVLRMNITHPPYDDVRVRQAIPAAVDNNVLLQLGIDGSGSEAANHHVGPMHIEYTDIGPHKRDVAKATGGSLRNPASFCGVVGLRPAPGRVQKGPGAEPFATLSVSGPMARNVGDLGLLMDAMAGPDSRDPRAQPAPEISFRRQAEMPKVPRRIGFSRNFGITPVDPEIAEICEAAARRFEAMGAIVEEAHPDFSGAHEAFQTLRAVSFATGMAVEYAEHLDQLKPDVIWNIEKALQITGAELARANRLRAEMVSNTTAFFDTYDLLLTPATIVPPFPVGDRTVMACDGQTFET